MFISKRTYVKGCLIVSVIACCGIISYFAYHQASAEKVLISSSNTSIQIINLDKSTERRQKYEAMLQSQNSSSSLFRDVKKIRLKATYGKTDLNFYDLENDNQEQVSVDNLKENTKYTVFDKTNNYSFTYRFNPKKSILHHTRHMSIGEFGCLMSHLRAIKNISHGDKDYGLVFEDDFVLLTSNFEKTLNNLMTTAPKDFCIIKFDTKKTNPISKIYSILRFGNNKNFSNTIGQNIIGSNAFTSGYLITKKCATQITNLLKTIEINGKEGAADLFFYRVLPSRYGFRNIWFTKTAVVDQSDIDSDIWDKKKSNNLNKFHTSLSTFTPSPNLTNLSL